MANLTAGGKRQGAGRPSKLRLFQRKLAEARQSMQERFWDSAALLALAQPDLMTQAITMAKSGDRLMLRFLIEHFNKLMGTLPEEQRTPYAAYSERIVAVIQRNINQLGAMDTRSKGDARGPVAEAEFSDVSPVLPPSEDSPGDGGREVGEVVSRGATGSSEAHVGEIVLVGGGTV